MSANRALPGSTLRLVSYNISWEAMSDPEYDLPAEMKPEDQSLFEGIARKPAAVIPRLEAWLERYPNNAKLLNYLSAAYSSADMPEKSRELAQRNFQANPDYLFAKLNYAEFFLAEKNLEKVKEIMGDKWDLTFHYPNRQVFHITEALGFITMAGRYMAGIGEVEAAGRYLDILRQLAPDSPNVRAVAQWIRTAKMAKVIERFTGFGKSKRQGKVNPWQ